jgi:hypothetical protein
VVEVMLLEQRGVADGINELRGEAMFEGDVLAEQRPPMRRGRCHAGRREPVRPARAGQEPIERRQRWVGLLLLPAAPGRSMARPVA